MKNAQTILQSIPFNIAIDKVFADRHDNPWLIEMFKIIELRKTPGSILRKLPHKLRDKTYIEVQKHHIIPKAWYKHNNYEIDNTDDNIVLLTIAEHVKVHYYLKCYFTRNKDAYMHYAMLQSLDYTCNGNNHSLAELTTLIIDDQLITDIETGIIEARKLRNFYWNNLTEEQRKVHSDKLKNFYARMSTEEKQLFAEKQRIKSIKMWKNRTTEQKNAIGKAISKSLQSRTQAQKTKQYQQMWNTIRSLPIEQQQKIHENRLAGNKRFLDSMTPEQRKNYDNARMKKRFATEKARSIEKQKQIHENKVEQVKKQWENFSEEQKQKRIDALTGKNKTKQEKQEQYKKIAESNRIAWKNMSNEKRESISNKMRQNMSSREIMYHPNFPTYKRVKSTEIQQHLDNGWKFGKSEATSKEYIENKKKRCLRENIPFPDYLS